MREQVIAMKDPKDYFELSDIKKLINGAKTKRDRALFITLFFSGRRVSEVLALRVNDILWGEKKINWLILKKKKKYKVVLPVPEIVLVALYDYLSSTGLLYKPDERVFPISRQRVDQILRKYGDELGIKTVGGKLPHAHAFRHSYSIYLSKKAVTPEDVYTIQELLQHSDVNVTMYYIKTFGKSKAKELIKKAFEEFF